MYRRVANGSERRRWQRHIPLNQNQPPPYIFLVREGREQEGSRGGDGGGWHVELDVRGGGGRR